jgi:hypothetical protein
LQLELELEKRKERRPKVVVEFELLFEEGKKRTKPITNITTFFLPCVVQILYSIPTSHIR